MCNTLVRNLEEKPRGWRASAEKVVILMFARSDTKVTDTSTVWWHILWELSLNDYYFSLL